MKQEIERQVGRELEREQLRLRALLAALCPDFAPGELKDCLQDVNLLVLRNAANFDDTREFWPWCRSFAIWQIKTSRQKKRRDRLLPSSDLLDELADMAAKERIGEHDGRGELIPHLRRCIAKLEPLERTLLAERYAVGGTVKAVAENHNLSAPSVSRLLYKTRKTLERCIKRSKHLNADADEFLANTLDSAFDKAAPLPVPGTNSAKCELIEQAFLNAFLRDNSTAVFSVGRYTAHRLAYAAGFAACLAAGAWAMSSKVKPKETAEAFSSGTTQKEQTEMIAPKTAFAATAVALSATLLPAESAQGASSLKSTGFALDASATKSSRPGANMQLEARAKTSQLSAAHKLDATKPTGFIVILQ